MKITLVLYVYPGIEKYLDILINSINSQTINEFDVIIFNDNLANVIQIFSNLQVQSTVVEVKGSINEIRFNSLRDIGLLGSEYIIFQDADDFMVENRIEENLKALEKYDLVVNDLSLVNENSQIMENSFWSKRLGNSFEFDDFFLRDKNIVGLGNTSIKKTLLLDPRLSFSDLPLAFDWFLFYQVFKLNNLKAVFITNTTTYYRQHEGNIAGIKKIDFNRIKHVLNVKDAHYNALLSVGLDFKKELFQLRKIKVEAIDFSQFNPDIKNLNLLWWEETNNLINIL